MRKPYREYEIVEFVHSYDVTLLHEESGVAVHFENVSRRYAAHYLKRGRRLGLVVQLVHFLDTRVYTDRMCSGCLARPTTWEGDCDGKFRTSQCGSEQCDWWASVRARRERM